MNDITDPCSVSQKFLAKCLRKTTRTVQTYTDEGMPRNPDGTYSVPDVWDWLLSRSGDGDGDALNPVQELARKNKALADKTEMEIAIKAGTLGDISQIADWYGGHIRKCKARLAQVPDAVGQFCDVRTAGIVVAEVRRLIHEALAELAAGRPKLGAVDSGVVGAAADSDGERVGRHDAQAVERVKRRARSVAHQ